MIKPYYQTELGVLYCGDCLEVMKELEDKSVDLVLTDPPYPNYNEDHGKDWNYIPIEKILSPINNRQFIFWSAVRDFPLEYSARHVWHKPNGQSNEHYEFIYERNGQKVYRVFRVPIINYKTLPEWTSHPTQKPLKLILKLIADYSKEDDMIVDPFIGSGTLAVACEKLNRRWIGIEISEKYCEIAKKRIKEEADQGKLFR